jgi:hypothetical protein
LPRNLHFLDMNNCSKRIQIPEILSMSPFFSKHEFLLHPKMLKRCDPWILRVYELLPVTTMLRLQDLMCPQLCHAPINKQSGSHGAATSITSISLSQRQAQFINPSFLQSHRWVGSP